MRAHLPKCAARLPKCAAHLVNPTDRDQMREHCVCCLLLMHGLVYVICTASHTTFMLLSGFLCLDSDVIFYTLTTVLFLL